MNILFNKYLFVESLQATKAQSIEECLMPKVLI